MPEPIAIATAVAALATNAYKLCFGIYQTIDSINNAPKHVCCISKDVKAFFLVLGTIRGFLDDEETVRGILHPAACNDLSVVLENSIVVLKDLNSLINEFITSHCIKVPSGTILVTKWQSFLATWNDGKIQRLRIALAEQKSSLNVAIAAANL